MITRFSCLVKIFTMPAPLLIQASAHRSAAPHIAKLPATISILPNVPLLPPGSRSDKELRVSRSSVRTFPEDRLRHR